MYYSFIDQYESADLQYGIETQNSNTSQEEYDEIECEYLDKEQEQLFQETENIVQEEVDNENLVQEDLEQALDEEVAEEVIEMETDSEIYTHEDNTLNNSNILKGIFYIS